MIREILIMVLLFSSTLYGFAQGKLKYNLKKAKGYSIWELKYQSEYKDYELVRVYFKTKKTEYSRISEIHHGVEVCYEADSNLYRLSMERKGNSMEYYDFHRDTTMNVPVPNMLVSGIFYKGVNGNLFMVNRLKTKSIFIDSMCREFENMKVFSVVCNTAFKGPYIYFVDSKNNKPLKPRDRKKLKLTTSELKEIVFIECY